MKRNVGLWARITCAVAFLLCFAAVAGANPAKPGFFQHVQSDGSVVYYQLRGDEFLHYMTDANGSLVAFGEGGDLYHVRWSDEGGGADSTGQNQSAGEPVGFVAITGVKAVGSAHSNAPASVSSTQSLKEPIPQHILDRAEKARRERDENWRKQFKKDGAPDDKAEKSSAYPAPAAPWEQKVLIIYVDFPNDPKLKNIPKPEPGELYKMMFDEKSFGTVAHYYDTVTDGSVKIVPAASSQPMAKKGIVFVSLPGAHKGWNVDDDNMEGFRKDVIAPALREADQYVNYAYFDKNDDKIITTDELSIRFIVHGYEESADLPKTDNYPSIWGHAGNLDNPYTSSYGGVKLSGYFAAGAFQTKEDQLLTIGILAHELGHSAFGFLDLYDISDYAKGLGDWSVMAYGNWGNKPNESSGSTPTALDAFHLQMLKIEPVALNERTYSLYGIHQYARLDNRTRPKQYFLLQARGNAGYDQGLGASWPPGNDNGLLICHVDDEIPGNNDLNKFAHFHVRVVEAHGGTQHLQGSYSNYGEADDLFSSATRKSFNNSTDPDSKLYYTVSSDVRTRTLPSGISITNINPSVTNSGTDRGIAEASFAAGNANANIGGDDEAGGCSATWFGIGALVLAGLALRKHLFR